MLASVVLVLLLFLLLHVFIPPTLIAKSIQQPYLPNKLFSFDDNAAAPSLPPLEAAALPLPPLEATALALAPPPAAAVSGILLSLTLSRLTFFDSPFFGPSRIVTKTWRLNSLSTVAALLL